MASTHEMDAKDSHGHGPMARAPTGPAADRRDLVLRFRAAVRALERNWPLSMVAILVAIILLSFVRAG
jgi:hypothetical protein